MIKRSPAKTKTLHRVLSRWYRKNYRKLPWRETNDPYKILISEVMLQQTQVGRVEMKFPEFIAKFPTLRTLAKASRADIIRAWQGMGYNNRAVRLRELAQVVVEKKGGRLPTDPMRLQALPGIGRYTANAISCFSHRQKVPVVDVNVRRVLSRIFWQMKSVADVRNEKEIWILAERILPNDVYGWNQALMEFGATLCMARKPRCENCPVRKVCASNMLYKKSVLKRDKNKAFKKEATFRNIPHRLWRGRVVEVLRSLNGKSALSLSKLGKVIMGNFSSRERLWLERLVESLIRDGVVERVRNSTKVKLAEG